MYKLFDKESGVYTLPNGSIKTSQELQSDPQYSLLFSRDCVIELVDGIFTSYETLANFANRYGIDYETGSSVSADEALAMALEKKKEQDTLNNMVASPSSVLYSAVKISALSFTDEQAIQVADLYPEFELNHDYKKDERFTYNGRLFKVNQAHTSQEQWVPGEVGTESLYTNLEMAGDGYLVWTQPTGAHNAYDTGDIVHYPTKEDQLYQSLIDGNTTIPGSDERWWKVYTAE